MIYDFDLEEVYTQSIEVDDIGNMCLRCQDAEGAEYYIATQTVMGKTAILKFGPVFPDLEEACEGYALFYDKIDYKEKKINTTVSMFINDSKKGIKQIESVDLTEALQAMPTYDKFITLGEQ